MEDTIIPNPKLCKTSNNLLRHLESKELSLEEFLQEVAYWVIKDGFDGIKFKQTPYKPQEVLEFERISQERRRQLKQEYFLERPAIMEWYRTANWVNRQNRECLRWLKEILSYLPKDDTVTKQKIKNQIVEFQSLENELGLEAECAKDLFNAREV